MASPKTSVVVLCGGQSAEHAISLISARFVASALDPERFDVRCIGITREGEWLLQDPRALLAGPADPRTIALDLERPRAHLERIGGAARLVVDGQPSTIVDVVFPVLHGPRGEDGAMQGLLEVVGVAYVGSGVLGSAVGMDKEVMKRLLAHAELPVVPCESLVRSAFPPASGLPLETPADAARREVALRLAALGFPLFVKPANLGSSVGISRVTCAEDLGAAIDLALEYDTKVIVERGVSGAREIECAVLGDLDPVASIPGEIVVRHADGFYSYAAKYLDDGAAPEIPAQLSPSQASAVQLLAIQAFRALDASGLARVDFLLSDTGELFINEINTLPGFTSISMYPKLWEHSGVGARELVSRLIDLALERAARRRSLRA